MVVNPKNLKYKVANKMKLGESEETNHSFKRIRIFELRADIVIKALGFDPEEMPKLLERGN